MAELTRRAVFPEPRSAGLCIASGSTYPEFAEKICASINETTEMERLKLQEAIGVEQPKIPDVKPAVVERRRFADGELFVRYDESLRGKDVFVVQPHHLRSTYYPDHWSPNDAIQEHILMIEASKGASASHTTAVSPYFGYSRQDKKDDGRVPISARRVVGQLLDAGAERIMSVDLHSAQIQGFTGTEPFENLFASPVLIKGILDWANEVHTSPEELVIVSPDAGRAKLIKYYADKIGSEWAIFDKDRSKDSERVRSGSLLGEIAGKACVIVDDMISTAGTLSETSRNLQQAGAERVIAAATHGLLVGDATRQLNESEFERIIVTDTVPTEEAQAEINNLEVCSVAPIVAEAIWKIHHDESVSDMFEPQRTDF